MVCLVSFGCGGVVCCIVVGAGHRPVVELFQRLSAGLGAKWQKRDAKPGSTGSVRQRWEEIGWAFGSKLGAEELKSLEVIRGGESVDR